LRVGAGTDDVVRVGPHRGVEQRAGIEVT
jgi:hypothetical protein